MVNRKKIIDVYIDCLYWLFLFGRSSWKYVAWKSLDVTTIISLTSI